MSGRVSFTDAIIDASKKDNTDATSYGNASGKVGTYYNYCATSAGTYCYEEDEGIGDSYYDICPINWHLPTSGSNGDYRSLFSSYSNNLVAVRNAFAAVFSGNNTSQSYYGVYGFYQSSTYADARYMYGMRTDADGFYTSHKLRRADGQSVRCIAK